VASKPTISRSFPEHLLKAFFGPQTLDASDPMDEQKLVNSKFDEAASYWAEVYERDDDINALIYQQRLRIVLELLWQIDLPQQERVLEVGCGAGQGAVVLAKLGYVVDAIDAVQVMVDATHDRTVKANVECMVRSHPGDVNALCFPDETFGLVVALGVLPWLPSMEKPVREMCRVLRPGGYLIISVGNRWGLPLFLDPFANFLLRPARQLAKRAFWRHGKLSPKTRWRLTSIRYCDALLDANRLEKLKGITFGFGPFTLFGYQFLPHSVGVRVHRGLTALADRGIPVLRSTGALYTVLGKKRCPSEKARELGDAPEQRLPPLATSANSTYAPSQLRGNSTRFSVRLGCVSDSEERGCPPRGGCFGDSGDCWKADFSPR
jgi:SAM-dependent methyltransferase